MIIESEGKCYGNIILNPRGKGGFGYDPIFEESSTRLTFAEMNNAVSYTHLTLPTILLV